MVQREHDQHPVRDLRPDNPDEPFGERVPSWASGRNLHDGNSGIRHSSIESGRELARTIPDKKREVSATIGEVHQQGPGLLERPGAVRMGGNPDTRTSRVSTSITNKQ